MRRTALLPLLLSAPLLAAEPQVTMLRVADGSGAVIGVVQVAGAGGSVVAALEGPRGNRLLLRRSPVAGGGVKHEMWLGGPPVFTLTRQGKEGLLVEAGGPPLRVHEEDLGRATIRCWIRALVSKAEPKLLDVSAGLKALKERSGAPSLGDVFFPAALLAGLADPPGTEPRGEVTVERGPFVGEGWDQLLGLAKAELGRP